MANYKPLYIVVATASTNLANGSVLYKKLSTTTWDLFLLDGSALTPAGAALASGAVLIYASTTTSGNLPAYRTFTDSNGYYAITLPTGDAYTVAAAS